MNSKAELKAIVWLSLPIIANGFLESSSGFTNTLLVAHLGEAELAVSALVTMLFTTLMVIFWGVISGVSIVISHYHGAEKTESIIGVMRDSLILAFITAIPIMLILWFAPHFFEWTGQSAFVVNESKKYLHSLVWAIPFDLPGFALMQLFSGISRPKINFLFTLGYIPFLIFINYCLMFGKFGLPALGLAGIGWGTALAYTVFFFAMWFFIKHQPAYKIYLDFKKAPKISYFKEILKVGAPLGAMYSVEIAFFLVLAIFMGKFGNDTLAAHQIVIQYFWIVMTIVFAIGHALSIRLGWRLGRGEPEWIMPIAKIGQAIVIFYALMVGLIYWFFPNHLIALDFGDYNNFSKPLMSIAISLFAYAALFQLADGMRITLFSILRGMKDTRFTLIASIIQFWLIALPISYYLAFVKFKTPEGLWIGLILSGFVGTLILWRRLKIVGALHATPVQ